MAKNSPAKARTAFKGALKTAPKAVEAKEVAPRDAAAMAPTKSHPMMVKASAKAPVGKCVTPAGKKDLTRYVRYPRYIRVQRQKAILLKRMKVPPAIAQFKAVLDKNKTAKVMKVIENVKPASRIEVRKEQREIAKAKSEGKVMESTFNRSMKYGIKEVVSAIENGSAKMVVIAADVDPIEIVVFLPALCRKMNVPFCFVASKAALGKAVGQKTLTTVAILDAAAADKSVFSELCSTFMSQYNDNVELRRSWGGSIMSKAFYKRQEEIAKMAKK